MFEAFYYLAPLSHSPPRHKQVVIVFIVEAIVDANMASFNAMMVHHSMILWRVETLGISVLRHIFISTSCLCFLVNNLHVFSTPCSTSFVDRPLFYFFFSLSSEDNLRMNCSPVRGSTGSCGVGFCKLRALTKLTRSTRDHFCSCI